MVTESAPLPEGATCQPNISVAGRRQRRRFGLVTGLVAAALFVGFLVLGLAWPWRLLVALPTMLSAVGFLQARRHTCVARAAEGVFENEDFSRSKMADADVAASRQVAKGIQRDSALIALAVAALAVLSAFVVR